jgi:hypothetical protein
MSYFQPPPSVFILYAGLMVKYTSILIRSKCIESLADPLVLGISFDTPTILHSASGMLHCAFAMLHYSGFCKCNSPPITPDLLHVYGATLHLFFAVFQYCNLGVNFPDPIFVLNHIGGLFISVGLVFTHFDCFLTYIGRFIYIVGLVITFDMSPLSPLFIKIVYYSVTTFLLIIEKIFHSLDFIIMSIHIFDYCVHWFEKKFGNRESQQFYDRIYRLFKSIGFFKDQIPKIKRQLPFLPSKKFVPYKNPHFLTKIFFFSFEILVFDVLKIDVD